MNQEMMRAAVLVGPKQIEVKEVPVPKLKPGIIEIKVSVCGVVTYPGDSSFNTHLNGLLQKPTRF